MPDQSANRENQPSQAVHKSIIFSIGVTVSIATMASLFHNSPLVQSSQQMLAIKTPGLSGEAIAENLLKISIQADESLTRQIVERFVAETSPSQISKVVSALIAKHDQVFAGPLAVRIAELGATRYQAVNLYLQLANEYISGENVKKNFARAKFILEMQSLKSNNLTYYYLGNLLAAPENKQKNIEKAKDYYKIAASKGIMKSKNALSKLNKR